MAQPGNCPASCVGGAEYGRSWHVHLAGDVVVQQRRDVQAQAALGVSRLREWCRRFGNAL